MKIKSEFYLDELFHLMHGINLQIEENERTVQRAWKTHALRTLLMPWRKKELDEKLFDDIKEVLKLTAVLTDVSKKIMESEGRDENGNFISLDEMISLTEED
jgi:hypothetical protein